MFRSATYRRRVVHGIAIAAMISGAVAASSVAAAQSQDVPAGWVDRSSAQPALTDLAATAARTAGDDFWVGYTFPLRAGVHVSCEQWRGRSISFGGGELHFHMADEREELHAERCDDDFGVFLRFADGNSEQVIEARLLTLRRAAVRLEDAVVWAGVYAADASVEYLRAATLRNGDRGSRAISTESGKVRERLLSAVAVHDGAASRQVVLAALDPGEPSELREDAVFWTGQVAGEEGVVRLLDVARNDGDKEVRKAAIFWLGQLAGEAVTADLADIAASDPETDVRTSAVFALSQSEGDAAIEALISIVRSNRNPEVVKSALFWLGESGDERVIALFEEILFGR